MDIKQIIRKNRIATAGIAAAAVLAAGGILVACTNGSTDATPAPAETTPVVVETGTPIETVEAPAETAPAVPTVGTTLAADQIEAARAAGLNVFVAPGQDTGLVVDPAAPLPEPVVAVVNAASPKSFATADEFWANGDTFTATTNAMREAGIAAFAVVAAPNIQGDVVMSTEYIVKGYGLPNAREYNKAHPRSPQSSPEAAIADATAKGLFADFPNVPFLG